jgi:hypothetical protein
MNKKKSWLTEQGELNIRSAQVACDYIKNVSGLKQVSVTRTPTYLYVNYVEDGILYTDRVRLPGKVLYCLSEDDFVPLFENILKILKNKIQRLENEETQLLDQI